MIEVKFSSHAATVTLKKLYPAEPREVEVKVRMSEGRAIIGLISSPTFPIQWEITTRGQTLEAICWKWNYFFTLFNLQNLFSHNVTNHRGVNGMPLHVFCFCYFWVSYSVLFEVKKLFASFSLGNWPIFRWIYPLVSLNLGTYLKSWRADQAADKKIWPS